MSPQNFLTRVVLENYKSIAACDVRPRPLTFLVGPNAAGKSNFLDALGFIGDAVGVSLEYALVRRGGLEEIIRRSKDKLYDFGIRLEFELPEEARGRYALRIGWREGAAEVLEEECVVGSSRVSQSDTRYRVCPGSQNVLTNARTASPVFRDNLYLTAASALPEFRSVRQQLAAMQVYNLDPAGIAGLSKGSARSWLATDGQNLASVLDHLQEHDRAAFERIVEYLRLILPTLAAIKVEEAGPGKTIRFLLYVAGFNDPQPFWAAQMSDGTLRSLGVLVALFQAGRYPGGHPAMVGIEEPEAQVHPAALGVLLDAMREASYRTQVLVTTHSPDLLDDKEIPTDSILAVTADQGRTRIGPVDGASRSVLRDHLFTAGELLRMNQFEPNGGAATESAPAAVQLFDPEGVR
jgi:predicted ATPase